MNIFMKFENIKWHFNNNLNPIQLYNKVNF